MIEVKNVTKSYGGEKVLKGVTLTVADGEFLSVMGRSGSGKSTLLGIIGGFLSPDGGQVLLDGRDLCALNDAETAKLRSTKLGFVFQSFKLIDTLSVRDNILLPASLSGENERKIEKNYAPLTEKLHIADVSDKYPDELSGGQCQRVAIARALLYEPSVLILDEPTGALDSMNETAVMELIASVNKNKGTTVIMVTHSQTVADYATRKIRLLDGKL